MSGPRGLNYARPPLWVRQIGCLPCHGMGYAQTPRRTTQVFCRRSGRRAFVVELTGTGRLADDLYLMAHHEVSGKPLLQPRAVGLGLAGALLAELLLAGRVRVGPGGVVVAEAAPSGDALADSVLALVLGEEQRRPAR